MAQACHAATAVLHTTRSDPNTIRYVEDYERMHKVVLEVIVVKLKCLFSPLYHTLFDRLRTMKRSLNWQSP